VSFLIFDPAREQDLLLGSTAQWKPLPLSRPTYAFGFAMSTATPRFRVTTLVLERPADPSLRSDLLVVANLHY
jgi:hypothetical protein